MHSSPSSDISPQSSAFSGFLFSQSNLQDYLDCRKRFQLRHLLKVAWPALDAEPAVENELALQQGDTFHRTVQQYFLGIPVERLTAILRDEPLVRWWQNFLKSIPSSLGKGVKRPEMTLSGSLDGFRLMAKYDLVTLSSKITIYDWKTSRKKPRRPWLAERIQTRLYPFLLVKAGTFLNQGAPFQPEHVEMIYWFTDFPDQPERFTYSNDQFKKDEEYLARLLSEITNLKAEEFTLTSNEQRCRYCTYRSLCARGVQAGSFDQAEEVETSQGELPFDFEQIAEIEF